MGYGVYINGNLAYTLDAQNGFHSNICLPVKKGDVITSDTDSGKLTFKARFYKHP